MTSDLTNPVFTDIHGVYQHCDEKHLHQYLAEFDFRSKKLLHLRKANLLDRGFSSKPPASGAEYCSLGRRNELWLASLGSSKFLRRRLGFYTSTFEIDAGL